MLVQCAYHDGLVVDQATRTRAAEEVLIRHQWTTGVPSQGKYSLKVHTENDESGGSNNHITSTINRTKEKKRRQQGHSTTAT
jgi:hypothetical protein